MSPLDADDIFTSCSHYIIDSLCSAKLDFLRSFFVDERCLCPGANSPVSELNLSTSRLDQSHDRAKQHCLDPVYTVEFSCLSEKRQGDARKPVGRLCCCEWAQLYTHPER